MQRADQLLADRHYPDNIQREIGRFNEAARRGDLEQAQEIALSLRCHQAVVPAAIQAVFPHFAEGGDVTDPLPLLPSKRFRSEDDSLLSGRKPRRRDMRDYVPLEEDLATK